MGGGRIDGSGKGEYGRRKRECARGKRCEGKERNMVVGGEIMLGGGRKNMGDGRGRS